MWAEEIHYGLLIPTKTPSEWLPRSSCTWGVFAHGTSSRITFICAHRVANNLLHTSNWSVYFADKSKFRIVERKEHFVQVYLTPTRSQGNWSQCCSMRSVDSGAGEQGQSRWWSLTWRTHDGAGTSMSSERITRKKEKYLNRRFTVITSVMSNLGDKNKDDKEKRLKEFPTGFSRWWFCSPKMFECVRMC